ncbi:MAG TPA: hypothetical protein VFO27_14635, partial [Bryobacteraceae bacterium]|nr:hypothetical protein [Bryobacteraceae bacterium]
TEVVTVRVRARIAVPKARPARPPRWNKSSEPQRRRVFTGDKYRLVTVFARDEIGEREKKGPALVIDYGSTTLIPPGWKFRVDRAGNLVARR